MTSPAQHREGKGPNNITVRQRAEYMKINVAFYTNFLIDLKEINFRRFFQRQAIFVLETTPFPVRDKTATVKPPTQTLLDPPKAHGEARSQTKLKQYRGR